MKSLRKKIGLSSGKSKIRNAKKHIYDGIEFDSGLEVTCYKELKANNISFEYNPKSFLLVEAFHTEIREYKFNKKGIITYNSKGNYRSINYTPDFVGDNWILETKGFANEIFPMRWKLFIRSLTLYSNPYKSLFIARNKKEILDCITLIQQLHE